MSNEQLIILLVSILVPILGGFAWLIHRMDAKFDKMDQRFDKLDQRFDKIHETVSNVYIRILYHVYRVLR